MYKHAWAGNVLRINLSSNRITIEDSAHYVNCYLGGKGLGQSIIFKEIPDSADALGEENAIVFSAGVLVGTIVPCACRLSIDSKNAVTGGVASSNAGGYFAAEMKYAGFDAIIVSGISYTPVYLYIHDSCVCLKSAKHIWGKGTRETENIIRSELQNNRIKTLSIGPAGENLLKSACIIVDGGRAAGRGALGAVMGSKNLKAIAISGSRKLRIYNRQTLRTEVNKCLNMINRCEIVNKFRTDGSPSTIYHANHMCRLPVRNFQDDHWDECKIKMVLPDKFEKYKMRNKACFNCPIYCSSYYNIRDGEFRGVNCEGFQANLIWDYMSKMDMTNPAAALRIQELCLDYGLDIDNSSGVISWAMELYEKGLLSRKDTNGLALDWGNYNSIIKLLHMLVHKEGLGELLSLGIMQASQSMGRETEYYAIQVKGQELAESIRSLKGWGLGTVVAPRGGGHLDGAITTEIARISSEESIAWFGVSTAGEPTTYKGKATAVFWMERFKAVIDTMGICCFATKWLNQDLIGMEEISKLFTAATGLDLSPEELMLTGQRVHNLEKAFNTCHKKFSREDDRPPKRLMEEPVKSGLYKGEKLKERCWDEMLDEYYLLHDWDRKTGWQTLKSLKRLRMPDVVERLSKKNLLM